MEIQSHWITDIKDVIKDIYNALEKEKRKAEESDKMVDDFFAKLGLKEG